MVAEEDRIPLGRVMLGTAFLLSIIYLFVGVAIEVLRWKLPYRWVVKTSLVLDSLPMQVLELLGLLEPVKESYVSGALSGFWLRVIFGATAVGVIFALAAFVGLLTWTARRAWEARAGRSAG